METTFEAGLCKTDVLLESDNENYQCFYDKLRDRSYYKVNEEYLLIVDAQKQKEVKKSYQSSMTKFWIATAVTALVTGGIVWAGIRYAQNREGKKKIQKNGTYQPLSTENK